MPVVEGVVTLLPKPDDYDVDFENPQRQYVSEYIGIYVGGMIIMFAFVGQNLYVRWYLQRKYREWATRWFMMPAAGVHGWEMPLERFTRFMKSFNIQAGIFNLVTLFAKLSILLYYRQLSPQLWWMRSVHAAIVLVVGYTFALFWAVIFQCNPVRKSWDVTVTYGYCVDQAALFMANAVFGIVTDLILLCLPFPLVWGLQMRWQQKAGVLFVFVIGSATFITSVIRVSLLLSPEMSSTDPSWDMCYTILWAIIEIQLLVICPSLCTLRAFAHHLRLMGDTTGASSSSGNNKASSGKPHSGSGLTTYGGSGGGGGGSSSRRKRMRKMGGGGGSGSTSRHYRDGAFETIEDHDGDYGYYDEEAGFDMITTVATTMTKNDDANDDGDAGKRASTVVVQQHHGITATDSNSVSSSSSISGDEAQHHDSGDNASYRLGSMGRKTARSNGTRTQGPAAMGTVVEAVAAPAPTATTRRSSGGGGGGGIARMMTFGRHQRNSGVGDSDSTAMAAATAGVSVDNPTWDPRPGDDPERGIVRTRSVTVTKSFVGTELR